MSVLEDDPFPFLLILLLFAIGAAVGIAGLGLARRWRGAAAAFGWLALICAFGCDIAGVIAMTVARSREHAEQLGRGITRANFEALHASGDQEGRVALVVGATMGLLPFVAGVAAILRARHPAPSGPPAAPEEPEVMPRL